MLVIRTFAAPEGSRFADVDEIVIEHDGVEVVLRRNGGAEEIITVDEEPRQLTLLNQDDRDELVGQFSVPVGEVLQARIRARRVTLHLADGTSVPLALEGSALPSWVHTGWKIGADDGTTFPIREDELTGMRGLMGFGDRLVRPQNPTGPGWKLKPTIDAEPFEVNPRPGEPGVHLDEITVVFRPGTDRSIIDAINAEIGARILRVPLISTAYRIKLPASVDLLRAYQHYSAKPEVQGLLPATDLAANVLPDEGTQAAYDIANLPAAWDAMLAATGQICGHQVRVGIIDNGVALRHPDLLLNIAINAGELPPGLFDADGNGMVEPAEALAFDRDGDGVIGFRDLNDPANAAIAPPDLDGNGLADAKDLLADPRWVDTVDNDDSDGDPESFIDDLVGWDFIMTGNDPSNDANEHGTQLASIVGAEGSLGGTAVGVAGVCWRVSIVPLRARATTGLGGPPGREKGRMLAEEFLDATVYAEALGIDIVNTSSSWTFASKDADLRFADLRDDNSAQTGIAGDLFALGLEAGVNAIRGPPWFDPATQSVTSRVLYTFSAGNNSFDLGDDGVYLMPAEFMETVMPRNVLIVGAAQDRESNRASSAYGAPIVEIWGPAQWITLDVAGTALITDPDKNQGTSFSAPTVAGVAALVLSRFPSLKGSPGLVHDRLLSTAARTVDVEFVTPLPFFPTIVRVESDRPLVDAHAAVTAP